MIFWGAINDTDEPIPDSNGQFNPDGVDLEGILQTEADAFCEGWHIPKPILRFSVRRAQPSQFRYEPGARTQECEVVISHAAAEHFMKGTTVEDFLVSARLTLFHELTHAVQYELKGARWLEQNLLICESHADIFGGYWTTSSLRIRDVEVVSKIAFAKGGTKKKGTHPPSCVRMNLASNGVQMGIRMLDAHKALDVSHSTRLELFEDSLGHARRILDGRERPCFYELDSALETRTKLCPVCPYTSQVGEKRKQVAALLGACNPKARVKRSAR